MFNRLAKINAGRRLLVPRLAPAHNNDNRRDRRLAAVSARPPQLTCHWAVASVDGRLECHWQVEAADEPAAEAAGPSFMTGQMPASRRRLARQAALPAS
jgi:hypothetical protein